MQASAARSLVRWTCVVVALVAFVVGGLFVVAFYGWFCVMGGVCVSRGRCICGCCLLCVCGISLDGCVDRVMCVRLLFLCGAELCEALAGVVCWRVTV